MRYLTYLPESISNVGAKAGLSSSSLERRRSGTRQLRYTVIHALSKVDDLIAVLANLQNKEASVGAQHLVVADQQPALTTTSLEYLISYHVESVWISTLPFPPTHFVKCHPFVRKLRNRPEDRAVTQ